MTRVHFELCLSICYQNVYFSNIEWDLSVFSGKLYTLLQKKQRSSDFSAFSSFFDHRANFLISGFSNKKHLNMHSNQTQTLKKTYRWLNSSFRRKRAHPECFSSMFRAWFESECDQRNLQNPGRRKITRSLVFCNNVNFQKKNTQIPLNVRKIPFW